MRARGRSGRHPILLSEATILIVDDEPALRDIFGHWLTAAGCGKLLTAVDGEDALALIKENPIDALVTDIRMPVMDGVTLVRRLAELGLTVPSIIFVSGFSTIDAREMYALGVEAFLPKPLRREDLLEALERALADRSLLWLTPMAVAPRQSLSIDAAALGEESGPNSVRLGRGGFSAHFAGWLSLGKVDFECALPAEDECIQGQGFVRWRSKSDQTLGIEFAYLHEASRHWIIEHLSANKPRSFIPSL